MVIVVVVVVMAVVVAISSKPEACSSVSAGSVKKERWKGGRERRRDGRGGCSVMCGSELRDAVSVSFKART
ncbi:hypothetical protein E2C01_090307 [Portunus trituberculatus]|uniref:Secreted protein n=1 Tax=Portunus trituberculatus TaxID=210409 RepID=A0A5B7JB37_PORTR|nr:hypothetical protein [Portunus trituberculatus]